MAGAGGSDLKSVMDRMGHAQITTTQKYLHALPDADAKNLDALSRIRGSQLGNADGALDVTASEPSLVRRTETAAQESRPGPRPGCPHGTPPWR